MPVEIIRLKQQDNLHFNLIKISEANAQAWMDYYRNQSEKSETIVLTNPNDQKAASRTADGSIAALHSLEFYNNPDTEVWLAIASYRPIDDPLAIDPDNIEMTVTVTTSENSPFTTHMGILRAVDSYNSADRHPNLANQLHTFAAYVMLNRDPKKLYMINVPAPVMLDIISKAFADKGANEAVYISDFNNKTKRNPTNNTEPPLQIDYEIKQGGLFNKLILKSFSLKDKNSNVVFEITEQQRKSEYKWFFDNDMLLKNATSLTPLVVYDLDQLAKLTKLNHEVQHSKDSSASLGEVGMFATPSDERKNTDSDQPRPPAKPSSKS
jgi:hypothetical protein